MKMTKMILLFFLIAYSSISGAVPRDSDEVELIVNIKKELFVGKFPPEVKMKIDPFKGAHGRNDVFIPIKWKLDKNVRITAEMKCHANDEALCDKLWVSCAYPNKYMSHMSALILKHDVPKKSITLAQNEDIKVDNPKWKWSFGAWGSFSTPIEARTYRANLRIQVEGDI